MKHLIFQTTVGLKKKAGWGGNGKLAKVAEVGSISGATKARASIRRIINQFCFVWGIYARHVLNQKA
jgi:hypothetical protein